MSCFAFSQKKYGWVDTTVTQVWKVRLFWEAKGMPAEIGYVKKTMIVYHAEPGEIGGQNRREPDWRIIGYFDAAMNPVDSVNHIEGIHPKTGKKFME